MTAFIIILATIITILISINNYNKLNIKFKNDNRSNNFNNDRQDYDKFK